MEPEGFFSQRLDSGVHVVGQPMAGVESAAIGLLVGTGARDEQTGKDGITHVTEQMLFRGTQKHDARALSEALDALGASYDTTAGLEMTLVSAVLLGTRIEPALELIAEVIHEPSFPEDDIDSVKTSLLQELYQREDQPAQKVMDVLRQHFFAGSPLSHDVLGTEETVSALTRDDVAAYWRDRYTANNMVISVAGNFDWDALMTQLSRLTQDWPSGRGRMDVPVPTPHPDITVMQREASQENIAFAFPAVPIGDPDYYAASLLSLALGGSTYSRLFREVRDKRGLAYAVQSRFDAMEKTGLMRIYVGTSTDRAHESIEVVMEELRKLEAEGLLEDELSVARTRLKSQMIMRSESTSARMVSNLRSWWFEGRLRSLDDLKEEIDRVTLDQVNTLAGSLGMTRTLGAVALGPRSEDELFGGVLARS